jgi:hypothetical protein
MNCKHMSNMEHISVVSRSPSMRYSVLTATDLPRCIRFVIPVAFLNIKKILESNKQ